VTCSGVPSHVTALATGCADDGAGAITCSFGTVAAHRGVVALGKLVPEAPGVMTCTATVSSATADPVTTNQSRTVERRIR
jgi:hypothetical protein